MTENVQKKHLYLVSDSTGETVHGLARACIVQFKDAANSIDEHEWYLMRTQDQMAKFAEDLKINPGPVIYTLVDEDLHKALTAICRSVSVPCLGVLQPIMSGLSHYWGLRSSHQPGLQHVLDQDYFEKMEALQFVLNHDDGHSTWSLQNADIILVGVSRTSKTPTCIYLANRGFRAANVPFVSSIPLPTILFEMEKPVIVGLTIDPERLIQIRTTRLHAMNDGGNHDYVDPVKVREELVTARRLFTQYHWPIIDVTKRSVEETATEIIQLYKQRQES